MLFVHIFMGTLQRLFARVPRSVRYRLMAICGAICLITPLALWISMTAWGLRLVLAIWLVAMILLAMLVWSSPDERI